MMKFCARQLLAVAVICNFSLFAFAQTNATRLSDSELIRSRSVRLLLSDTAYATEQSYRFTDDIRYALDGDGYFASMNTEGGWNDISYHSQIKSAWEPSWHLYRLLLVCRQYQKNKAKTYLAAIHRGVSFWINNDFICPNWWQNQINTPFAYASLMLMLGSEATGQERAYLDNVLSKRVAQKNPTGQNKIWQHDIEARLALIHGDTAQLGQALRGMASVITVSTAEGIQPDYSFQQHGPMLQFGNYGLHFINSLLYWLTVTAHTSYAFSADKQAILINYCAQGIRWSVFKGGMDITAIGRQLRPNAASKRGRSLYDDFQLLKSFNQRDAMPVYTRRTRQQRP